MIHLDTRRLVDRLKTIESVALIPRVASTNLIARRIVAECIENELSLPSAMIIAGEQFVRNAPPPVVQQSEARRVELRAKIEKLMENQ